MRPIERLLPLLAGVRGEGPWTARCPAHDDRHNSLSLAEGANRCVLAKCFAGCAVGDIVAAVGLSERDLFADGGATEGRGRAGGLTLAEYGAAKRLPLDFLRGLGLREIVHAGQPAIEIPYLLPDGGAGPRRLRAALHKDAENDGRFFWKRGDRPTLYGLDRLGEAREAGHVVLCEGESDTQTLWLHGVPAVGLPGASNWNEARDAPHLAGIGAIYVIVEPDRGGETVRASLGASSLRGRVRFVTLDGCKDTSALHCADPEAFDGRFSAALAASVPWRAEEQPPARPSRIVRAGEIALAPPDFLVDDLLVRNTLAALVAKSGSFKSFVAIDLAAAVLTGLPWAGREVKRGPVLYLAAEGAAGVRRRLRAWEIAHDETSLADLLLLPATTNFLSDEGAELIEGEVAALPASPRLIVVDTLNRHFGGGKENEAGDMARFFATCDRLRLLTGACVLTVHHERRDGGYRGSSVFEADLDTMIGVARDDRAVTLTCLKQKDAEEFAPIRLLGHVVELGMLDGKGQMLTSLVFRPQSEPSGPIAAAERALNESERKALAALEAAPERRLTYSAWQAAAGLAKTTFDRAKDELIKLGKVGRLLRGGYEVLTPTPIEPPTDPRIGTPTPIPLRRWESVGVVTEGAGDDDAAGLTAR